MKNKKTIYYLLVLFSLFSITNSFAQEILKDILNKITIHGGLDLYYAYDTDKDKLLSNNLFSISPHRDQFRLNLATLGLKYNDSNARGYIAIHYGDIVKENWQTDNPYLQQANVGIEVYDNLWIDAGYFLSYIGEESLPYESSFSSFALPSQYQPFYESGIQISYDYKNLIGGTLHIINGYNLIEDNNKNKSIGLQLYYQPKEYLKFIYNTLVGNEMPSSETGRLRVFNDFIISFGPLKNFEASLLFDITMQENSKLSDSTSSAYSYGAVAILQYHITPKFKTMLRGEYYQDLDGILSGIIAKDMGMKGNGLTVGFQYNPIDNAYLRFESRYLRLDKSLDIFYNNKNEMLEFIISAGIGF